MKKKVLVIGSSLKDKGGIVTVMKNIEDSLLNKKLEFVHLDTYNSVSALGKVVIYFKSLIGLFYLLITQNFVCAHIHMSYKGSYYRKSIIINILSSIKVPVILHIHGSCFADWYNGLNDRTKNKCKAALNKCEKVIVLSDSWKNFFLGLLPEHKIEVLKNSVSIPPIEYKDRRKKVEKVNFLFLGRLGQRKGVYDLLDCIETIIGMDKSLSEKMGFVLAGDGDIEKVNQIIDEKGLGNVVVNKGWIGGTEKEGLLLNSNVFILPSYNEGLPMAILEAMSYHLPVISTYVGGIPEVVQDAENGFLISPGDKEILIKRICYFVNNPQECIAMGDRAFSIIKEEFNQEKELMKLERLYLSI